MNTRSITAAAHASKESIHHIGRSLRHTFLITTTTCVRQLVYNGKCHQ